MEDLYIRLENGAPIDHPILGVNLKEAFQIDLDNLPENFAKFERVSFVQAKPGIYFVHLNSTYGWDGNVVKDIHTFRPMSEEEKTQLQNAIKQEWQITNGYPSWVFDEDLCVMKPPIPMPENGEYVWDESTVSWRLV